MHQLLDFGWKYLAELDKYIPTTTWFNLESKELIKFELPNYNFSIKLSENKFCTGYYLDDGYHECPQRNILESKTASQCLVCERLQGFKSAFLFGSQPNENMQKYLSQKHFLYIAYFEPGLLKVGTASELRKKIRPIEQDALIYAYIAESDGFNIQKIEKYVSKNLGITETVKTSHKVKYLSRRPNAELAKDLITKTKDKIFAKVDWKIEQDLNCWLFSEDKLNIEDLTIQENIYYPSSFNKLDNELNLYGTFAGLRGRFLIIKLKQIDYIFDTNFLIGRTIENISNYEYNETSSDQYSLL